MSIKCKTCGNTQYFVIPIVTSACVEVKEDGKVAHLFYAEGVSYKPKDTLEAAVRHGEVMCGLSDGSNWTCKSKDIEMDGVSGEVVKPDAAVSTGMQTFKKEDDSDVKCPECGSPMIKRKGKRGPFYGCSTYPKCSGTQRISGGGGYGGYKKSAPAADTGVVCDDCGKPMILRNGSRGQFYGCSGYPKCKHTKNV